LATVIAAGIAFLHFRETPPPLRTIHSTLLPPENGDFDFTSIALPAISPDGTLMVYGARAGKTGKPQLWLRRLDSPTGQPLAGTEEATLPFWSPDNRWIAFGQGNKLRKINVQGGPPLSIADLPGPFRGGTWNMEGVILFGVNAQTPILRITASGGSPVPATVNSGDSPRFSHRAPWFLPDGRHFLYTNSQDGDIPIRVGSVDEPSKPGKLVAHSNSTAQYAQGNLLFLRESTLMAQPFDVSRLETTGEAAPLAEGIPTFTSPSRPAGFAVSPAGLLVYAGGEGGKPSPLQWRDRQGNILNQIEVPAAIRCMSLSPDGKRLAACIQEDLYIYDIARRVPTRFTFQGGYARGPVWSPDGNFLYFGALIKETSDLFRRPSNGSTDATLILSTSFTKLPSSVSPDGKLLLFTTTGKGSPLEIWAVEATPAGTNQPRPFLHSSFSQQAGQFSPDGQWVAYMSDESGQAQVYVAPFSNPGGKRQLSANGGGQPHWRQDGKEIFYLVNDRLMAAEVSARNGTLEIGKMQELFGGVSTRFGNQYDVTSDGQKFIVVESATATSRPLTLVQNWTNALRK
jgi:Tol biopolymer transport system component